MYSTKTITGFLVALVFTIFLAYFLIQDSAFDSGKVIGRQINKITAEAKAGDWVKAKKSAAEFEHYWNRVKFFVALNNAEQDYSDFEQAVHHMQGAVEAKQADEVVSLSVQAKELWGNFMRVVPLP